MSIADLLAVAIENRHEAFSGKVASVMSGVDSARLKASPLETPWTRLAPLPERACPHVMDDGTICGPYQPNVKNQIRCSRHSCTRMATGGPEYRARAGKRLSE